MTKERTPIEKEIIEKYGLDKANMMVAVANLTMIFAAAQFHNPQFEEVARRTLRNHFAFLSAIVEMTEEEYTVGVRRLLEYALNHSHKVSPQQITFATCPTSDVN